MEKIQTQSVSCTMHFIFALTVLISGCTSRLIKPGEDFSQPTPLASLAKQDPTDITVMTYNVENMFDNQHDDNREDFAYLPIEQKSKSEVVAFCKSVSNNYRRKECEELDWSNEVVKTKLENVAQVIRTVDMGKGPDNLMLVEVENESIVKRLVNEQLKDLGYKTVVVLEGPDTRGIDPGFISKFPLASKPVMHIIPYIEKDPEQLKWAQRSRGLLEVTIQLPNKKNLTFMIGHFPSQTNPVEWRSQAVNFAKNLIQQKMDNGQAVIFGGDLNITDEEDKKHGFFTKEFTEVGQVSHLVGCKSCLGTHNYKGGWSFLDALIFSKNINQSGFELITESFEVVRTSGNMKKNGAPLAFRSENKKNMGVSDHFPLFSRLRLLK